MPVLKNARHEKFAQALAKGKTELQADMVANDEGLRSGKEQADGEV